MSHQSSSGGDASTCKMQMLFNTYTIDACFLTPEWQIKSNGAFAATCIGLMLLVVVLEASRRMGKEYDDFVARQLHRQAAAAAARLRRLELELGGGAGGNKSPEPRTTSSSRCGPTTTATATWAPQTVTLRASPLQQLVRAVLHAVAFGLAYMVMLIAMYYNVVLLVMILLGAGMGKFFCDWMTRTIVVVPDGGAVSDRVSRKAVDEPSVCCG